MEVFEKYRTYLIFFCLGDFFYHAMDLKICISVTGTYIKGEKQRFPFKYEGKFHCLGRAELDESL